MNGLDPVKARWRVVYRTPWAHMTNGELQSHIDAVRAILARLEPSDHNGYFVRLWHQRLAELQAELNTPGRVSGKGRRGRRARGE